MKTRVIFALLTPPVVIAGWLAGALVDAYHEARERREVRP